VGATAHLSKRTIGLGEAGQGENQHPRDRRSVNLCVKRELLKKEPGKLKGINGQYLGGGQKKVDR